MLSGLMDKVDRIQEQMARTGREMNILRMKKECQREKNTVTEMKNIFDEVVSTVDVAEEMGCINRILENKKKTKRTSTGEKAKPEYSGIVGQL